MTEKPNPIEEYFSDSRDYESKFSELFKGNDAFIDQMTQLTHKNVRDITTLTVNDSYLSQHGIPPVFGGYCQKFMRLMVSHDRKSRGEYVDVHKGEMLRDTMRPVTPEGTK